MKYYLYVFLILISNSAESGYLEYIEYRNEFGNEAACNKVNEFYKSASNLYEKAYFFGKKSGCYRKTNDFKDLKKKEKNDYYNDYSKEKASYVTKALDSNEIPDKDLLDLVGVSENYPKLYERLEKKKIQAYLNAPVVAPDENEGDVHDVSYFVASDFKNMIHRYLENNMPKEAERLAKEYGKYPWAGEHGIKLMQEEIKTHQAILDEKIKNKKENIIEKIEPKKVTAKLTEALNELENNEILEEKTSLIDKAIENAESEIIELDLTAHKHWLFIFALIIVFGLYFNSRRKG